MAHTQDARQPPDESWRQEQVEKALSELHSIYYGIDGNVARQRAAVENALAKLMSAYDIYLG